MLFGLYAILIFKRVYII